MEELEERLNSIIPDAQITIELENIKQLPFLSAVVNREADGELTATVSRKAKNAMQMQHFDSNHSKGKK